MGDAGPSTPSRLPRVERRAQIVEAAAHAFLARGFDGTSMEDVAKRAGVTRLVVYRIFDTKEQLYRAVLTSVTDDLTAEFRGKDMAAIRKAGGIVPLLLPIARRHPDAFRVLWRQSPREPLFADFSRQFRSVLAGFTEAVVRSSGRPVAPPLQRWCATALASHLLDGMCAWLDADASELDAAYVVVQTCGLLALLDAWSDPHPPEWLRVDRPGD